MKKTDRNQNMPDQQLSKNNSVNTGSLQKGDIVPGEDRFSDANLDQPAVRKTQQYYDDMTGTVENRIDNLK